MDKKQNISSEDYFIGCLLKDYSFTINTCSVVGFKGEYLESSTARAIFNSAESLFASGVAVDIASVSEDLEQNARHIDNASASAYMMKAITFANDPHHILHHMTIIKEKYRRRNVGQILQDGIEKLQESGGDVDDITSWVKHSLTFMEQELSQVTETKEDLRAKQKDRYSKVRSAGASGIKSRYAQIQIRLASYQFKKLTIIAARPKMGKSTLALNEAIHTAVDNNIPTAIFSIEMDREELMEKAASDITGMDNAKLKRGEYSEEQIEKFLKEGYDIVDVAPLTIIDDSAITIEKICSKIRQLQAEKGVKLVVIDYLQIISSTPGSKFQNRTYEIQYWTNQLRSVAKDTGVAIILLSQISRPPKGFGQDYDPTKVPMPTMNDLKDSGAIEQDAYAILLIGPSQDPKPQPSWMGAVPTCIRIEANRGGTTGDFECMFDKPHNRFMSFAQYEKYRSKYFEDKEEDS